MVNISRATSGPLSKVASLCLILLASACATGVPHEGGSHDSTIRGYLQAVGGSPLGTGRPIAGRVTASGKEGAFSVSVGSTGQFSIPVFAGTYTVTGTSPDFNGGKTKCIAASPVTVQENGTVVVQVFCQEK